MSRPIDADAVKGLIRSGISVDTYADQDYVCELVDDIPTIDAVSVVRCKDCKHNPKYTDDYMYGKCIFCCEDDFYSGTPNDDWFCADGERKGE